MANNTVSEKKKALVARKEKLLQDIQYYEKRISDFQANRSATTIYEDNCSSYSDSDFPMIDNGPSVTQLKLQQSHLKTSLQATQELTNLHLLEHEVNILVTDPVLDNGPQVREPGVWKEVIAECRLDLVPFSITFHVHRPSVKFGAPSYRNLKVILTKPAHETELANSVLAHTTTPSDAVEVLRSYSSAHRSRRTTLARLAEKYPNLLFMEPLAEGGYILKCAGLLEVCWTLQNKWSPIAPFHHRMRFDLEYMDESYIKIITQYHRQLSDPSLETDERTALLCKIINTCLEAKGPTQELYESMESDDPETAQTLRQRRMTLDQEVTETAPKRKRDDAIMAPPKSLPKKSKPKGKENKVQGNEERAISKVRSSDGNNVTNASGRDSVVSGKSKDAKSTKESDGTGEKLAKETTDKDVNAKSAKEVFNSGKDKAKHTKEMSNRKDENSAKEKDNTLASMKSKDSGKDAKSTKESDVRKENAKLAKEVTDRGENSKPTKEVSNSGKGNSEPTKETEHRKDQKSVKEKDGRKDAVAKSKENAEHRNSVAKSTKEVSDGTKSQRNVKDGNNLKENNAKITKTIDDESNSKDTNVASVKAPKKSTKDKNLEDESKKNSSQVPKKSVAPKVKDNVNEKNYKGIEKVNSDKGTTAKEKLNTNPKNTDVNKITENIEKNAPKKVKKTDDIANIPAKKAKIDHTRKNSDTNVKTTENSKKSTNNINKPPKTLQINKNNAKTNDEAENKGSTYTKSSETIQKLTEKNSIVTKKPNLSERTDIAQKSVKNIESIPKNSNTNPKKGMTIYDKVKNIEQNMKTNIQEAKSLNNVQNKMRNMQNNLENNKNVNNGKLSQKLKVSTGNTKLSSVKKLSAGNTVKETSAESKVSKIPQSLTKVSSSLKKNPLRISPRKLSSNFKGVSSVKKAIQKPITSIPRLLKKPVVKT